MIIKKKKIEKIKKDINNKNREDNNGVKKEDKMGFNLKDDFKLSNFKIFRAKWDKIKRKAIRLDRLKMSIERIEISKKLSSH